MDKYKKVEKPKQDVEIKENEIRITTQGKMRNYISYATGLFREKNVMEVVLKAMGRAINKTVTIAEIIKRRIANLHQITQIESTDIKDVWEPLEVGLDTIETTRHVSSITIILSSNPLDTTSPGYQPPIPADQVRPVDTYIPRPRGRGGRGIRGFRGGRSRGRSRGRGFRSVPPQQDGPPGTPDANFGGNGGGGGGFGGFGRSRGYSRGRSRSRGRGRGFRGRGRAPPMYDNNGPPRIYDNSGPPRTYDNNNNNSNPRIYDNNNNNNNNNNFGGGGGEILGRGRSSGPPRTYDNNNNNNFGGGGGENLGRGRFRGRGRRGGRGRGRGINNPQQAPQEII